MNKSSIVAVAVLALVVGFAMSWVISSNRPVELEAGTWFGDQARALPEFELLDHNSQPLTRVSLNGKWNLIFFGYTHCPDICPTSMQTLSDMVGAIDDPDVANALRIYFVSVDPDRDKPEVLASYASYFNPAFTGATAQMEQLEPLTRSLGIAHGIRNRVEGNPVYDVDHSAAIVLVNPQAEFAGLFGAPHDPAVMARDMTRIVEYN
ncbi:MAG: SCO family protein [Gammaproteobacteria bacterium]|nr:SCO family protein [Gammaproteobacteria bacterium]